MERDDETMRMVEPDAVQQSEKATHKFRPSILYSDLCQICGEYEEDHAGSPRT
jgi:hypothetical protein